MFDKEIGEKEFIILYDSSITLFKKSERECEHAKTNKQARKKRKSYIKQVHEYTPKQHEIKKH